MFTQRRHNPRTRILTPSRPPADRSADPAGCGCLTEAGSCATDLLPAALLAWPAAWPPCQGAGPGRGPARAAAQLAWAARGAAVSVRARGGGPGAGETSAASRCASRGGACRPQWCGSGGCSRAPGSGRPAGQPPPLPTRGGPRRGRLLRLRLRGRSRSRAWGLIFTPRGAYIFITVLQKNKILTPICICL